MADATHIQFAANDRSYFSIIKRAIHKKAVDMGFSEQRVGEIDIIAAELTSNLYKYAVDGEILLGTFLEVNNPYIELISIDNGPGISNTTRILQDGYSSSNTMGHGLGSIKRLSDNFDIYSQTGWGTIVLSRVYLKEIVKPVIPLTIRPIVLSKPGETTSGDGFLIKFTKDTVNFILCDGLGHGPEANKAVNEADKAFQMLRENDPIEILRFLHSSIKKTRGMVANVASFDIKAKTWRSAGIGNIAARWLGPMQAKNHMSYNGIVGHNIPNTMNVQEYSADQFNQLVMASDGIKTRWEMIRYPMIHKCDAALLAAAIYKDHARHTDDMSVVVIRYK